MLFQAQTAGRLSTLSATARQALLAAGLGLIAAGCVVTDPAHFPYPWAVLPVAGTVLAIAAITGGPPLGGGVAARLRRPVVTLIGRLSYSLYLWHWCIDVLFRWTWGLDRLEQQATAIVLTFGMAALSYRLVERPVRTAAWVRQAPKTAIVLAGIAAALLAREATRQMVRAQDLVTLSVVRQHGPSWYPEPVQGIEGAGQCPVVTRDTNTGLAHDIEMHRVCTPPRIAPAIMRHRLFILGDSHAIAYTTMASMVARAADVEVRIYSAAGCTVANMLGGSTPPCAAVIDRAIADIGARAQPDDVVLLASLRAVRTSEQWGPFSPAELTARTPNEAGRRDGLEEATRIVAALTRSRGINLVFEAPKPVFAAPVFRCVDWFDAGNPACRGGLSIERGAALRSREPVMDGIAVLQSRVPALAIWDPFDVLCPGETCQAMTPDGPLFIDGDHLSARANRLLYPGFAGLLRGYWPDMLGGG